MTSRDAKWLVGSLVILSAALLAIWPAAFAADEGPMHEHGPMAPGAPPPQGDRAPEMPPPPPMCPMCMKNMQTLKQVDETLAAAKKAADAGDAKAAATEIAKAQGILQGHQKMMHEMMHQMLQGRAKMMEHHMNMMKEQMQKESQMKCPMCGKMMGGDKMDAPPMGGRRMGGGPMMGAHRMGGKPAGDAKVVNQRCPITGNKIDPTKAPDDLTREFKGRKVGFCCPGCPPAWDKLNDEQKQEKLDAAMKPAEGEKPGEEK